VNHDSDSFSIYGDNKGDKDKKSSLQQFYDALNNRNPDRKRQDGANDINAIGAKNRFDTRQDFNSEDDSNLPEGIREKAQKLKSVVTDDSTSIFNPARGRSSFDNFFGLREEVPEPEPISRSKFGSGSDSFIDQFKKTLDKQSAASGLAPGLSKLLPNPATTGSSLVPGLRPFVASTHQELTQSSPESSTTVGNVTTLRDMNATVLNQWNPLYQPPKLELPKPAVPSSASFMQVPRRQF
jgi:hypothetical protein